MKVSDANLTPQDVTVVINALLLQRASYLRSRNCEVVGSEMFDVRTRQIETINTIRTKFEGGLI